MDFSAFTEDPKSRLLLVMALFSSAYLIYFKLYCPLIEHWKRREKLKKTYELNFERRDSLMYHIGSCKARGDLDDAKQLMGELSEVDEVCSYIWAPCHHSSVLCYCGVLTSVLGCCAATLMIHACQSGAGFVGERTESGLLDLNIRRSVGSRW